MTNLADILSELRRERDRIDAAITALTNGSVRRGVGFRARKRRHLSAAARAKIAAAQRARWAKQKAAAKKAAS